MDKKKRFAALRPFSMHVDLDQFNPASDEEKFMQAKMRPSTTFFKDGMRRFSKNWVAMTSLIIIVLITLGAVFIPMFWPYT